MMNSRLNIFFLLFFVINALISAQSDSAAEQIFSRRIFWSGGEHAYRFAVEVQRSENGTYRNYLREFAMTPSLDVAVPEGDYRFRITPHDILDRPVETSRWFYFEVRRKQEAADTPIQTAGSQPLPGTETQTADGGTSSPAEVSAGGGGEPDYSDVNEFDYLIVSEEEEIPAEKAPHFNTLGMFFGTSFIDPLFIAGLNVTISPFQNIFIEIGCEFGFISVYDDVENFYSIYPYANLGLFLPFRNTGGFFVGAGAGYMMGSYAFAYGNADFDIWALNVTAGFNLGDAVNISYTAKTNFVNASNRLSIGFIHRFRKKPVQESAEYEAIIEEEDYYSDE